MGRSLGASSAIFGALMVSTPSGERDDVTVLGSTSCNDFTCNVRVCMANYGC